MKTALITGASSGIGAAFARELAACQTNLILVARSQERLQQLANTLEEEFSLQTCVIPQDLSLPEAATAVWEAVSQRGLQVDLLVNNAGFGDYGAFASRQLPRQLQMVQVNVTALVALTHLFLPDMQQRGKGSIINVASIAGFQPLPYLSVYAATKAFVVSFTEALWAENQGTGVRILALCPGPTETEFFQAAEFPETFASKNQNSGITPEEVVRDALKALEKNQPTLVTGGPGNQVIVNLPRFLPRDWLVSNLEKQFRP